MDEMSLTSIDLSQTARTTSTALLNARLADALDLAAQLKHAQHCGHERG
jgi:hypothetical protein